MRTTALIADEQIPQRRALREMLATLWPELVIVAECSDGLAAIEALEQHNPRVAFLDLHMPGASGLEVARRASDAAHIVFTTAYDARVVSALEAASALNYVLKPVTPERLNATLRQLRAHLPEGLPNIADALENLRRRLIAPGDAPHPQWITACVGNVIRMIALEDVQFFKAHAEHIEVVAHGEQALIEASLQELLATLDPQQFWQIHHGVIVRVRAIEHVRGTHPGAMELSVAGCAEVLPVSPAYQHRFHGT